MEDAVDGTSGSDDWDWATSGLNECSWTSSSCALGRTSRCSDEWGWTSSSGALGWTCISDEWGWTSSSGALGWTSISDEWGWTSSESPSVDLSFAFSVETLLAASSASTAEFWYLQLHATVQPLHRNNIRICGRHFGDHIENVQKRLFSPTRFQPRFFHPHRHPFQASLIL